MPAATLRRPAAQGRLFVWILFFLLIGCTLLSFTMGKYALTLHDTLGILSHYLLGTAANYPASSETVFLQVRTPRLLSCIFVGAALSVSGAVYQGIFKNPMVSPDLLGPPPAAPSGPAAASCWASPI